MRAYDPTTCKKCGLEEMRRRDAIKVWSGLCFKCSQKEVAARPEIRAQRSASARAQLLAQGGIPNAKKFDKSRVGPNHPHWKGGVTPWHQAIRTSLAYKEWRQKVLRGANYTCAGCGRRGGQLICDHIKPFSLFPDLRLEVTNGRPLCGPCDKELGWKYRRTKSAPVASI